MTKVLGRRAVLQAMGYGVGVLALPGCGGATIVPGRAAWATGGTAVMKGGYADPFASGIGATCKLTCSATIGPCYAKTISRKDISEGQPGLPVRLAFLVLDEQCRPIPHASVDIWHAGPAGMYSGDDGEPMCTMDDPKALAARWFRGVQKTDAKGRVDFDTCFPGWYHGRTIHVHFIVTTTDGHTVTSQLFFDDGLVDAIVAKEPGYDTRGLRDTNNTNDGVIGKDEVADYLFTTSRQHDGAMLAAKAIILQTHGEVCETKGGEGGPPGPGGFPPGGPPDGPGGHHHGPPPKGPPSKGDAGAS